jgi:glutathione S-transferase
MTFAFPLVGLVSLLSVAIFFWIGLNEAKNRQKHDCPPPAMTGPDELLRYMRVRGNTMEGLLIFFPALWLFAFSWGDGVAATVGLLYPIGRILYARGYYVAADKRSTGFTIGFLATAILWLGAVAGMGMQALGM